MEYIFVKVITNYILRPYPASRYRSYFENYVRLITVIMAKHLVGRKWGKKNIEWLYFNNYAGENLKFTQCIWLFDSGGKVDTETSKKNSKYFYERVLITEFSTKIKKQESKPTRGGDKATHDGIVMFTMCIRVFLCS